MATHPYTAARQIEDLESETRYRLDTAAATPVIDPAVLALMLREDKLTAAEVLARLDPRKLVVQAIAHTNWINQRYGLDDADMVQTEDVLASFQRGIARFQVRRVTSEVETTTDGMAFVMTVIESA